MGVLSLQYVGFAFLQFLYWRRWWTALHNSVHCVHEVLSSTDLYDLCSRLKDPDVFNWSLYEGGPQVWSFAVCCVSFLAPFEMGVRTEDSL